MIGAVSASSDTEDKSLSSVDLTDDSVKHTDTKHIEKNSANDAKIIKNNPKKLQSTNTIKNVNNSLKKTEKLDNLVNTDDSNNKNQIAAPNGDDNPKLGSNNLDAKAFALNVTVEQNTSFVIDVNEDFKGKVKINCDDKELYDGETKTLLTLAKLTAGEKIATVEFYGDTDYDNLTINDVNFTVSRVTPTINVNINDITYPRVAQANITIGNNANGTVNVIVDDEIFNGIVINGNVTVNLNGLSAGYKEAKVEFVSDDDYNNNVNSSAKFIVYPNNSLINFIDKQDVYKVGEDIEINFETINSTGDLTVYLNGEKYGDLVRDNPDTHVVSLDGLLEGNYTITLVLDGDQNYTRYTTTASFKVVKNDLTIVVNDTTIPTSIVVGSPVTFTAKLNESVTGDVIFNINGANYTVSIVNNTYVNYEYTPLNNSTITVIATFVGNDEYNSNVSTQKTLTVNRIPTTITLSNFREHLISGDDGIFNINMDPGINGYVTLMVNDKPYNVAILNGEGMYVVNKLSNGNYNIKAIFEGDDRYEGSSYENELTVQSIKTKLNITINKESMSCNDTATISISLLNEDDRILSINAIVTVKVNGNNNTVGLVNGKGYFTLKNLDKNDYLITAVFAGDDKYLQSTSNDVELKVNGTDILTNTNVNIVNSSIFVGDKATIKIHLNQSVNGIVTINVNDIEYIIGISKGNGTLILSDLSEGIYNINATFAGDNIYNGSTSSIEQLRVNKIPTNTTISIDKTSIGFNDKAIVSVVLNQPVNGVVTVNVNGTDYITGISNGKGNLILTHLDKGTYKINTIFTGDDKYIKSTSNTLNLEVTKVNTQVDINVNSNIFVGDTAKITINMNPKINGTVKLTIGNETNNIAIINGQGIYTTNNLSPDTYQIKAEYTGDDNHISSTSTTKKLTVKKISTKLTINTNNSISVGDTAKITINMNPTINGIVKLNINDKTYNVAIVKGTGNYDIYNLENGEYNINAVFTGDDKYSNSTALKKLTVNKIPTTIIAQNKNYKNKYTTYTVKIKNNQATLQIGKKTYTQKINKKGIATYKINNKTYKITAKLNKKTKKYNIILQAESKTNQKTSNNKGIATFKIENTNTNHQYNTILKTTKGELIKNQKITLNINGKTINTQTNNNGKATFTLNLKKGTYKATITYNGDKTYKTSTKTTKIIIK